MKLIYHTERATAELGYGRGMNAWAVATKGFYFHTFTQSLSLSIGLIIAMSLSTASKENILLKLALNSFLSIKTLFHGHICNGNRLKSILETIST